MAVGLRVRTRYTTRSQSNHLHRTRNLRRYHTPSIKITLQARTCHKEALAVSAKKAYSSYLDELSQKFCGRFRSIVNKLALGDCLCSFALVASQDGYVKAQICDGDDLEINQGRHPMIEALRDDPFVPNDILFTQNHRSKIITGSLFSLSLSLSC